MNLWTKQRSITHISYQMCRVALLKTWIWKGRGEGPACPCRQVVWVLSACPMTPIFPRASISNPHSTCQPQRSAEKPPQLRPSVGLFESDQKLPTTGSIGCIKLIKVVGGRRHLCSHNARWKSSSGGGSGGGSHSPGRLRICLCSQERSKKKKRPNKTRVKAIESFFSKWSLIGPFFLADPVVWFWWWQSTYPQFCL